MLSKNIIYDTHKTTNHANIKNRKQSTAYLFLALQLLLNLPTKLWQQDFSALGHPEQLRVDHILNAGHLGLGQSTQGHISDDLQDVTTEKGES